MSRPKGFHHTEKTKARIATGMYKLSDSRYGSAKPAETLTCAWCAGPLSDWARSYGPRFWCSFNCEAAYAADELAYPDGGDGSEAPAGDRPAKEAAPGTERGELS
jgi:hypothetical protein